eukprot:349934-Chlamydomonas_euryale.AAC.1
MSPLGSTTSPAAQRYIDAGPYALLVPTRRSGPPGHDLREEAHIEGVQRLQRRGTETAETPCAEPCEGWGGIAVGALDASSQQRLACTAGAERWQTEAAFHNRARRASTCPCLLGRGPGTGHPLRAGCGGVPAARTHSSQYRQYRDGRLWWCACGTHPQLPVQAVQGGQAVVMCLRHAPTAPPSTGSTGMAGCGGVPKARTHSSQYREYRGTSLEEAPYHAPLRRSPLARTSSSWYRLRYDAVSALSSVLFSSSATICASTTGRMLFHICTRTHPVQGHASGVVYAAHARVAEALIAAPRGSPSLQPRGGAGQ